MPWTYAPAAGLLLALAAPAAAQSVDTMALRAHTRFLADDILLGRDTGTPGERIAAAYIVSQLIQLGLKPVARDSFLHPIPLRAARLEQDSRITVIGNVDSSSFDIGEGFVVNAGGLGAFRDFRGGAVLLGAPEHAVDLIGAAGSLGGRVAVFLGPLGAHARELLPALGRAGAAGVIVLVPEPEMYDVYRRSRGDTRYFVEAPVDDPIWQPSLPVIMASPALSRALGGDSAVPRTLLDGSAQRPVDLGRTVAARLHVNLQDVSAANVAALLPGSDPARRDEYVVYTAHYDHLGVSLPDQSGDSIYNGFSDNAAGVAMLLGIAEAMRSAPPPRSVVFVFFTGEERGLLGSSYFAATSPLPITRIVGLINLDAGAPPVPPVSWRIAGGTESALGRRAQQLAAARGWTANLSAASPNSDYWPFLQRSVPSVFIIPGDQWEDTTSAERDALRRRWDRYHRADDHWHLDFPFAGLKRYAEFALLLGLELAHSR